LPPSASPEIAQIIEGLSRTTARIWVVDRNGTVLARAGTLKPPRSASPNESFAARLGHATLGRLYALVLQQPTNDFRDDATTEGAPHGRDVEGALAGILTTNRRATSDGRAVIVSAAHPIWVGDQVRGTVIVEETGNAVLAERNRAFERLFNIVLAVLLVGSLALTTYATWLSSRIRRLRDDAERAIDEHGRVRGALASSRAGDEIGDLSRSFSSVLARLSEYASYQESMASRLSHELRTPIAVVRSSLDNLKAESVRPDDRVFIARARDGLARLTQILTRMSEAARLEQGLAEVERERFDLVPVVAGCVAGYEVAYPTARIAFTSAAGPIVVDGAPDLIAQMFDKLVANAVDFAQGAPIDIALGRDDAEARLTVTNEGPPLPEGMGGRLFESMVSLRKGGGDSEPHLGLGLYIVRVIAGFHGGRAQAADRFDGKGVIATVVLPLAAE
jgi:dedicated sortase system histidine kinase